jgi:selenocysteine lyase/cysteine desulfurase
MTTLAEAIDSFDNPGGYIAAASSGLPTRRTRAALSEEIDAWAAAQRTPAHYDSVVASSRASFARLVGVLPERVAIGSQTSVLAGMVAASAPAGAEILCVAGDFSSMVFPFLQRGDLLVRHAPISALAEAISERTWLVAFSHIQSATGVVADLAAIAEAASRHGARTLCDTTQSAGVHPIDASLFDATVCHTYKWLCAPRGVAFLTVSESFQADLVPSGAGWYAGEDPWASCYGPDMHLAPDARRFDVSPAWQAFVGAEPALELFASLDIAAVWGHAAALGDALCSGLGIPPQHQAIVTWPDDGVTLGRLRDAGITASGRAGRVRAAFHLWNDERDVEATLRALR